MPRKEFESFTRLDASDVNTYLMDQSVMTFAGTAARGSAIATPVEGMYAHLNDTDSLEYYDGSAWVNRIPTATPAGLTLISTTTFSGVASQNIDDVFSSTYDSYKVVFNLTATGNTGLRIQMRAGGSPETGSNYARQYVLVTAGSFFAGRNTTQTSYDLTDVNNKGTGEITVFNPNKAEPTSFSALSGYAVASNDLYWFSTVGNHQLSNAYTGFTIFPGTGTITGQLSVYGLAK